MNQRLFVAMAALVMLVATTATAQFTIPRSVVGSGGTVAYGAGVGIAGTIGQALIGRTTGAPMRGAFGFWHGLTPYTPSAVTGENNSNSMFDASTIQVMPHPVVSRSNVRVNIPAGSVATLRLYDGLGRMRSTLIDNETVNGSISLPADDLESGTYTLVLVVNGKQISKKVQVTR
ncbi:MAG: T9SS type A sorting domain-containing protein [bacterium]|nr:T9SS type A sorting domain-containing protein [Candidatus Kapabacteria bacterium]